METKNRQRMLFIAVVAMLGLIVLDRAVFNPLKDSWEARQERIEKLKKDVDDGTRLISPASKKVILGKWQKMQDDSLPANHSEAESKILKAFDRWEQVSRVKRDRITPQWKPEDEYTTLEFRADVSGPMQAIETFLFNVEHDLPSLALKVESIEITAHDNEGQQLTLALQLSGLVLGQGTATQQ